MTVSSGYSSRQLTVRYTLGSRRVYWAHMNYQLKQSQSSVSMDFPFAKTHRGREKYIILERRRCRFCLNVTYVIVQQIGMYTKEAVSHGLGTQFPTCLQSPTSDGIVLAGFAGHLSENA